MDLERLAALEAEATSAPWHMFASRSGWSIGPSNDDPGEPSVLANFRSDAWLLMELRNAAVDLISSARRAVELEAENERLRGDLRALKYARGLEPTARFYCTIHYDHTITSLDVSWWEDFHCWVHNHCGSSVAQIPGAGVLLKRHLASAHTEKGSNDG